MSNFSDEILRLKPVRLEGVPAWGNFFVTVRRDSVYGVRERLEFLLDFLQEQDRALEAFFEEHPNSLLREHYLDPRLLLRKNVETIFRALSDTLFQGTTEEGMESTREEGRHGSAQIDG